MGVFHVKKTSVGEDQKSLVFKGKIVEGPITQGTVIPMKIYDVVQFDKQKDEDKKIGLVIDFYNLPDDMEVIMGLNIANEDLNIVNT